MKRVELKRCYVYLYFDTKGIPLYVGKGKKLRWRDHKYSHNPILKRMITKYKELPCIIFRERLSDYEAFELEKILIAALGRRDQRTGPLINFTDGGEGLVKPSQEAVEKWRNKCTGRKRTPEQRARMSAAHKGKSLSPEHKAKLSKASKGKVIGPFSAQTRERMRQAKLGIKCSAEAIAARAEGLRRAHARRGKHIVITNGEQNKHIKVNQDIPDGWYLGLTRNYVVSEETRLKISNTLKMRNAQLRAQS